MTDVCYKNTGISLSWSEELVKSGTSPMTGALQQQLLTVSVGDRNRHWGVDPGDLNFLHNCIL